MGSLSGGKNGLSYHTIDVAGHLWERLSYSSGPNQDDDYAAADDDSCHFAESLVTLSSSVCKKLLHNPRVPVRRNS